LVAFTIRETLRLMAIACKHSVTTVIVVVMITSTNHSIYTLISTCLPHGIRV
jgi:hypothetical protein